jgi:hypothetical protein
MRFIKLFLLSIIVLFTIITLVSLLLPSHVRISRAINIAAPASAIRPQLANLKNWEEWNMLIRDSSSPVSSLKEGEIITERLQIVLQSAGADSISTRWIQRNGKSFSSSFAMMTSAEVTVVQWYFDFQLRWYPWEKFGSIIYDQQMGPGMEKSLGELKTLVETSR